MNLIRNKRIDVFHSEWVDGATFCGKDEIPLVESSEEIPEAMIPFSEAVKKKSKAEVTNKIYVHFFEHDFEFWRFILNPKKYIRRLKKYAGVVSPDISIFVDMPRAMQCFHVYVAHAISYFLIKNGIKVIPLVRWAAEPSYEFAFEGCRQQSTICVSAYGNSMGDDKEMFYKGFYEMVKRLNPACILFYGNMAKDAKAYCESIGIRVVEYKLNRFGDKISTIKSQSDINSLPLFR